MIVLREDGVPPPSRRAEFVLLPTTGAPLLEMPPLRESVPRQSTQLGVLPERVPVRTASLPESKTPPPTSLLGATPATTMPSANTSGAAKPPRETAGAPKSPGATRMPIGADTERAP